MTTITDIVNEAAIELSLTLLPLTHVEIGDGYMVMILLLDLLLLHMMFYVVLPDDL